MVFFTQSLLEDFKGLLGNPNLNVYCYDYLESNNKLSNLIGAMKNCCGNHIGTSYLNQQNRALKSKNDAYDLALITYEKDLKPSSLSTNILGFIIVQKNECAKFQDAYCINLICSPSNDNRTKGIGSLLFALYLYCVINNNNVVENGKLGLLELANSYINIGGLCLYSKYGFEYDSSLYGDDCFNDYNNLPMIVDMKSKYEYPNIERSNQILKEIALGINKGFPKPTLCSISNNHKQLLLGILSNLDNFLKQNKTEYIISFIKSDYTTVEYEILFNELSNDPSKVDAKINELISTVSSELSPNDMELLQKIYIAPEQPQRKITRRNPGVTGGSRRRNRRRTKRINK